MMGWLLARLPQWAPAWIAASGGDGGSAQLIWLHAMSWLLIGIAVSYFLRCAGAGAAKWLHYEPSQPIGMAEVVLWRDWTTSASSAWSPMGGCWDGMSLIWTESMADTERWTEARRAA